MLPPTPAATLAGTRPICDTDFNSKKRQAVVFTEAGKRSCASCLLVMWFVHKQSPFARIFYLGRCIHARVGQMWTQLNTQELNRRSTTRHKHNPWHDRCAWNLLTDSLPWSFWSLRWHGAASGECLGSMQGSCRIPPLWFLSAPFNIQQISSPVLWWQKYSGKEFKNKCFGVSGSCYLTWSVYKWLPCCQTISHVQPWCEISRDSSKMKNVI